MNLEQKTAGAIETLQQTTRGGGCGIVGIGCGIVAILCVTMCVGSYFLTMHSSIPLSMIESALESEGNVQVEGLKGTISSGFEIESLKFESDECDEWNELNKVRFSYNGFFNLMRTKRLIISEASIGGATIYTNIDGNGKVDVASDIDGEEVANEFSEEWQGIQDDLESDGNNVDDLKEFRIDLLSANNVAIVDPKTGTRLHFTKVEFKDYQMLGGKVTRLGDLEVLSDQIDLHSEKSTFYSDEPVAWNLKGQVKPAVHKSLIKEIPFNVDFAIQGSNKFRLHLNLFNGQVEIDEPYGDERRIRLNDFSHTNYFETKSALEPSDWNVELTIVTSSDDRGADQKSSDSDSNDKTSEKKNNNQQIHTLDIKPGGSFVLGSTKFDIEAGQIVFGPDGKMEPPFVAATGRLGGQEIAASITLYEEAPWFAIALKSTDEDSIEQPKDLWSQLFFEKPYVALDGDQQTQVDSAMKKTDPMRAADEFEAVDF